MAQKLGYLHETASQTAGPFVHIGLAPGAAGFEIFDQELGWDIAGPNAEGERITVEGIVYDGTGSPVKDVLIEVWQANAKGAHAHPEDPSGEAETGFRGRSGLPMAPHLSLWIVARGINIGLHTRMYFSDEDAANAKDPVINSVEVPDRRKTLIATRGEQDGKVVYRFDIRLQGDDETVFFDI